MKALAGLMILTIVMSSCMHEACPTYSGSKGYSSTNGSSKKSKPVRNQTPYYKVTRMAEVD